MDKFILLVGFLTLLAVCTSHPPRQSPGANYMMKSPRLRHGQPRRPAFRSKVTLPVNPNAQVRHRVSVQKVPVHDGQLNIIKQTVVLKSPKKPGSRPRYTPNKKARPSLHSPYNGAKSYNTAPARGGSGQGRSRGRMGGKGQGRRGGNNNNNNNNRNNHPSLLPALTKLNQNIGGLIDALRASSGSVNPTSVYPTSVSPMTFIDTNKLGQPLPIVVVDNKNSGFGHGQTNPPRHSYSGPGQLGGNFGLQGHSQLNQEFGLPSYFPQSPGGLGFPGSGQAGSGLRHSSSHLGRGSFGLSRSSKGSLRDSGFSSSSSSNNSPNELLILPNGPKTKAIRISTNGKIRFAQVKGKNSRNGIVLVNKHKTSKPVVNGPTTPSGEDPPEAGEIGEV